MVISDSNAPPLPLNHNVLDTVMHQPLKISHLTIYCSLKSAGLLYFILKH